MRIRRTEKEGVTGEKEIYFIYTKDIYLRFYTVELRYMLTILGLTLNPVVI